VRQDDQQPQGLISPSTRLEDWHHERRSRRDGPHRDAAPVDVGRELRNELAGIHSARRGSYRVPYRIDESKRTVTVLRVDHRGDVYRTT
jgi:mRNA-degrading endonuclease RelE of RelBE toxin-antitoxin system